MRTLLAILFILPLSVGLLQAQTPALMNYQGLARDYEGNVLADCDLSLRISILKDGPGGSSVFTEIHRVRTNQYGLFTLTIGSGEIRRGLLDQVDWGKGTYWLQVEMDEAGGEQYSLLGATQLLSVPYAMYSTHAESADRVLNDETRATSSSTSSPGSPWDTDGNEGTDPAMEFLGTTDITPLIIKTNNVERMRLTPYGKIGIGTDYPVSTVDVGGNMTIGSGYAGLKPAPEDGLLVEGRVGIGEFFPNARFEVKGGMVVGDGYTGVHQPPLDGALFAGRVGIGTPSPGSMLGVTRSLSVGRNFADNEAPIDGAAFEGKVGIGTTIPVSMLGVNGGAAIGAQYSRSFLAPPNGLIVQGSTGVGTEQPASKMGVAGNMAIGQTYASLYNAPENGLIVEGAVGIGVHSTIYKFHVLGNSFFDGTMKVADSINGYGPLTIFDDTDVPVIMTMDDALEAERYLASINTHGAGAVRKNMNVGVDIGIGRDGYVGRNLKVGGTATFKNLVVENYADIGTNPDSEYDPDLNPDPKAPVTLINEGETVLKDLTRIESTMPALSTGLGALSVAGGVAVGDNLMIGGQIYIDWEKGDVTASEFNSFPIILRDVNQGISISLNTTGSNANKYMDFRDGMGGRGSIQGETLLEHYLDPWYILDAVGDLVEFGIQTWDFAGAVADARPCAGVGAVACPPGAMPIASGAAGLVLSVAKQIVTQVQHGLNWGVSYSSGYADYAEWLEKEHPDESFSYGDIVGARGGKINKDTRDAHALFIISQAPMVLGNMPAEGEEHLYEKCAFLGQVPVKVQGPVAMGDFIIPSGNNDGIGIAVSPDDLTADQAALVVGIAWQTLPFAIRSYVNVAVGMAMQSTSLIVKKQQQKIASMEQDMNDLRTVLRDFIPDIDFRLADEKAARGEAADVDVIPAVRPPATPPVPMTIDEALEILDEKLFDEAITLARNYYKQGGSIPDENPLFQMLAQDASFKVRFLNAIKASARPESDGAEMKAVLDEIHVTVKAEIMRTMESMQTH